MQLLSSDIHNHLLPGVDDGFKDVQDSLEAIGRMAALGCKSITFTPHLNPEFFPHTNEDILREQYRKFSALIPQDYGVTTALAAEYMVVNGFERKVAEDADNLLHYDDNSILIEMSYFFRSRNLEDSVFELNMAGYRPIIAHPERYLYMADCLDDYEKLRDMGCRFQINYLSLTGAYGHKSTTILKYLLKHGCCDFFSSDLHTLAQMDNILDGKIIFPLRKFREILA